MACTFCEILDQPLPTRAFVQLFVFEKSESNRILSGKLMYRRITVTTKKLVMRKISSRLKARIPQSYCFDWVMLPACHRKAVCSEVGLLSELLFLYHVYVWCMKLCGKDEAVRYMNTDRTLKTIVNHIHFIERNLEIYDNVVFGTSIRHQLSFLLVNSIGPLFPSKTPMWKM